MERAFTKQSPPARPAATTPRSVELSGGGDASSH